MPFCPICKMGHPAHLGCGDVTGQILHGAGLSRPKMSEQEFKATARKADLIVILLFILAAAGAWLLWLAIGH